MGPIRRRRFQSSELPRWRHIFPMGVARALRRRLLKVEASPSAKAWRLPTDYVAMHESASGTQLPTSAIYAKAILDGDPHWYEKHVMGSGPFKFLSYEVGQSIKGERNPDYYRPGQPYLDGFTGIYGPKQSVRTDAIVADRAAGEFRGLPPSVRDQLQQQLGDKIVSQSSDWNCSNLVTPNHKKKPFDDVRVRRALTLSIDQWHG